MSDVHKKKFPVDFLEAVQKNSFSEFPILK